MRDLESSSRGRLRAAAKALFAERGYEATAISDITRAARTSHSQFLKYYSDKDQLRREIIDDQWRELTRSVVLASLSVRSPAEKLRLALNMFVSLLEKDPEYRAILLLEQSVSREQGSPRGGPAFEEFIAVLDDILDAMNGAGELAKRAEPQALRSALVGAIEGMMRHQLLAASNFPARYSIEQVRSTLSALIESACDFQRPSAEARTAQPGEQPAVGSEDEWIRYYLKLADRALHPSELS